MRTSALGACAALLSSCVAQQVGTNQQEVHPPLTTYACDATGACTPDTTTTVTLDAK